MPSTNRYPEEFKADAVAMCERGDRSQRKLAVDLGVSLWTLREWCKIARMGKRKIKGGGKAAAVPVVEETADQTIARLERELSAANRAIARLEEDRTILKKAALDSTCQRYLFPKDIHWRPIRERLPGSRVHLSRNPVQITLGRA